MIIGLTGGIASGKSTISSIFKSLDIPVVDADMIAREVVEPGEESYKKIVEAFGDDLLLADQTIDRKKLGAIVFNDRDKRQLLNGIVHPAVRKRMLDRKDAYLLDNESVVLDIPLLFESKLTHFVDRTLLVYVTSDTQLRRLVNRDGFTEEEALSRIRSQLSLDEKREWADAIIDNNGSIEQSKGQLLGLLKEWGVL
ncbi:dephospho-CoA kinase [Alkalihalobacillus sp. AL-G]|uniref:dephospho-CoA kinase n=1 Tax=Alkalihalobacillus sp. AL-G TaxID=2926399 RepID=UPI00272AC0D3|nr:dephospho-CoA kinase [Alkalihalobacillus sp. AL-G]WLD92337.1 dephospho-CoA kinase [Alkalihalobacillus sp. AL-G]